MGLDFEGLKEKYCWNAGHPGKILKRTAIFPLVQKKVLDSVRRPYTKGGGKL
jgi:hypothetical protein